MKKRNKWIYQLKKFSLFARIQAGIATFTLLFTILHPPMALMGNPLDIPTLNPGGFNSSLMQNVYDQTYFLNSLDEWEQVADYYVGLLRANWESSADNAIQSYVDSITTSDSVNSLDDYKDFMHKSLESQKLDLLASWEKDASTQFLAIVPWQQIMISQNTNLSP